MAQTDEEAFQIVVAGLFDLAALNTNASSSNGLGSEGRMIRGEM
jgi:hypothetical protein